MGMVVSCFSNIMYLSEKMVLWLTCVGLISCIILMFIVTLGMGIGLGYNYCFVDLRTKYKHIPGHYLYRNMRSDGGDQMPPETTENPLDEALRNIVTHIPEEPPPNFTSNEYDDIKPSRNNYYSRKITNETDLLDLVEKLGLNDNTTDMEYSNNKEEVTTNNNVTETIETDVFPETTLETTTVYTNTYSHFDDIDKGAEISDAIRPTVGDSNTVVADPYTDDVTEAPVVDIDVDSPDQSGGKRVKKLVIPISGLDLISLLSKLKTENRNYSLQIVTT